MPVKVSMSGDSAAFARELEVFMNLGDVTVGVGLPNTPHPGDRAQASGLSLADVAEIVENGNHEAGIPPRPIFGPAMDENAGKYVDMLGDAIKEALRRGGTRQKLEARLRGVAGEMVEDVHRKQQEQDFEPLAESTIDRKGHDEAWFEDGYVLGALEAVVEIDRNFSTGNRFHDRLGRFAKVGVK